MRCVGYVSIIATRRSNRGCPSIWLRVLESSSHDRLDTWDIFSLCTGRCGHKWVAPFVWSRVARKSAAVVVTDGSLVSARGSSGRPKVGAMTVIMFTDGYSLDKDWCWT
jgi:hypothetical protein